jgi:endonuclease YncB( thermonuclease family)
VAVKTGPLLAAIALVLAIAMAMVPPAHAASLDLVLGFPDGQRGAEAGWPMTIQLNIAAGQGGDDKGGGGSAGSAAKLLSLAYIIQVVGPDGFTAYLTAGGLQLESGAGRTIGVSWMPEKDGMHRIQAFVVNPAGSALLAPPKTMSVEVAAAAFAPACTGSASCISGIVTKVVDGDTLDINNNIRIRLSLVNTPERGEPGYSEARAFTASLCPVGSQVLVDEDDDQTRGSYGRMVAKVFCGNAMLNEQLLESGHAAMYERYCSQSEFASEPWARKFGC